MTETNLFASYLDLLRRQKGLTLTDIERRCDKRITSSYLSRIFKGEIRNLTVDAIAALAQGLDADPFDIFAAAMGRPARAAEAQLNIREVDPLLLGDTIQKILINPQLLELAQEWVRLTGGQQAALLQSARFLNRKKAGKVKARR